MENRQMGAGKKKKSWKWYIDIVMNSLCFTIKSFYYSVYFHLILYIKRKKSTY
jgi:hypothetical protein